MSDLSLLILAFSAYFLFHHLVIFLTNSVEFVIADPSLKYVVPANIFKVAENGIWLLDCIS